MKNLFRVLKGHEKETFYCTIWGDVVLKKIIEHQDDRGYSPGIYFTTSTGDIRFIDLDGHFEEGIGETILFPSYLDRDWSKWYIPKTWDTMSNRKLVEVETNPDGITRISGDPFYGKPALAFIQIRQLIEMEYGGNITPGEWKNHDIKKYSIQPKGNFFTVVCSNDFSHVAFHTHGDASDFLKTNSELLKDFYENY